MENFEPEGVEVHYETDEPHSTFLIPQNDEDVDNLMKKIEVRELVFFNMNRQIENDFREDKEFFIETFGEAQTLEKELGEMLEEAQRIKYRDAKKAAVTKINNFLEQLTGMIAILRGNVVDGATLNRESIAKLNNLAYKAVAKRKGLNKMVDKRAMQNLSYYEKLDKEIAEKQKGFDFSQLEKDNFELVDRVGTCPLSALNATESMENGDCLCLGLDIARNEAAIADPTQLRIKDIIPTFMSANSFLDSASYHMKREGEKAAAFGADKEGNLAPGAYRETITGVLPLYLFPEHWEFSKRLAPSVFGLMCTLDIMGFTPEQMDVVPFLVLKKALENKIEKPSEMNEFVYQLVLQTCMQILTQKPQLREKLIRQLRAFNEDPLARLKDEIPSLAVFMMQMIALDKVQDEIKLDQDIFDWISFVRFAFEEASRRLIPNDFNSPNGATLMNWLDADAHKEFIDEIIRLKKVRETYLFEKEDEEVPENPRGLKKEEEEEMVENFVSNEPWEAMMNDETSNLGQITDRGKKMVGKGMRVFKHFIKETGLNEG